MDLEFFETLYRDQEFCEAIGRMTLAAGRSESNLRRFLSLNGVDVPEDRATLGSLTRELKSHDLLSENGVQVLRVLKTQRNYLTHSLFDLFSARVDETLLPRKDLIPEDVELFIENARDLGQELSRLSEIIEERIDQLNLVSRPSGEDARLFRP